MNYRLLGATGLKVSELGFGCSRLGGTVDRRDDGEVLATVRAALDQGVNFFDTADIYAQGGAEKLLAQAVKGRRSQIVIAGKAGYELSSTGALLAKCKSLVRPLVRFSPAARNAAAKVRAAQIRQNFSPPYLRKAVERSLRRLDTGYLDVLQLHNPPASQAARDDLGEILQRLQTEGKVRHYGVACAETSDAAHWLKLPGLATLQIRLNLLDFEEAQPIMREAAARGIGIIARQALAPGMQQGIAAPQALQFVLHFREVSVVIVGMRSRAHLFENLHSCKAASPALV